MEEIQYPPDYVPPYTKDDILPRFLYYYTESYKYAQFINKRTPGSRLSIDHLVMLNVVISALDDIWRFKTYHLRDRRKRSDAVKRAAYMTKWITRLRPIYFERSLDLAGVETHIDRNDMSMLANENLAIHVSLSTLATDAKVDQITLEPEFFANFQYDLHYRSLSEDALLNIYDILRNIASGASPIAKSSNWNA